MRQKKHIPLLEKMHTKIRISLETKLQLQFKKNPKYIYKFIYRIKLFFFDTVQLSSLYFIYDFYGKTLGSIKHRFVGNKSFTDDSLVCAVCDQFLLNKKMPKPNAKPRKPMVASNLLRLVLDQLSLLVILFGFEP